VSVKGTGAQKMACLLKEFLDTRGILIIRITIRARICITVSARICIRFELKNRRLLARRFHLIVDFLDYVISLVVLVTCDDAMMCHCHANVNDVLLRRCFRRKYEKLIARKEVL
jgi:hypothetical protein